MTRSDSCFRSKVPPIAVALVLVVLACPGIASGQVRQPGLQVSGEPERVHSFEITVGGELLTPQSLGSATATMSSNNQTGSAYTYFSMTGTRALAPALRGRLGYNLTSTFSVEGGVLIARSNVEGTVTGDVEGATAPTMTESLTQYFVDVSLLAHLRTASFAGGAGVPFLEGGGGYLRQMHGGSVASSTGQIYHFGGGVTYMFSRRPASRLTGLGFRADARVYIPRKGYSFGNTQQVFAGVGGSLVFAF